MSRESRQTSPTEPRYRVSHKLWRKLRGGVVVGSSLWTLTAVAEPLPSEFLAHYEFSGGQAERDALEKEIERVADQFNPFVRSFAKSRLHDRIKPYEEVVFDKPKDTPRVHLGEHTLLPCDGKWHEVLGDKKEEGRGICSFDGRHLSTRTEYDKAVRENTMTFSKDGKTVLVSARLESPKLPDSLRFQLTYKRP